MASGGAHDVPLSTSGSAVGPEEAALVEDGYAAEVGSPSNGMRRSESSSRGFGPSAMPWRQKAMVACLTLMLVCAMVVLGGMLGIQLGKQAISRGGPAPEEVGVDNDRDREGTAAVVVAATTTTFETTEAPVDTTMTPSGGHVRAHKDEEETTLATTTTLPPTTTTETVTTTTPVPTTTTTTYFPTLFCFSVMRSSPDGYELSLVRTQLAKGASIFGCESWRVYSDKKIWLTPGPPVRLEATLLRVGLEAPAGVKEHILNTEIFMTAWRQAHEEGLTQSHEWSVKVDPDAVFFPKRLQQRLSRYVKAPGGSIYFLNCKLSFQLYGALEVFSKVAMEKYFDGGEDRCKAELPWTTYGEDLFFRRCMDLLAITPISDYGMLSDEYCAVKPFPCTANSAAFHPFKASETYFKCIGEAEQADKTRALAK